MAIPSSIRVPGTYVTIDNTKALQGALVSASKTVILGQKTSDGTATAEQMVQVFSKENADELFGIGSVLSEMFDKWFDGTLANAVYAVPLDDATGATPAEYTVTVTGPATAAGTIALYINGTKISVGVASGDTETTIASAIETAIGTATTDSKLPVIASAALGVCTLVAKNDGTLGNQIRIKQNLSVDDATPAGVTVVIAQSVVGATDVDVADAIAALPDDIINWIVTPYTDSSNLTTLTTELDRRWGELVQLDGHAICAYSETAANVITKGDALNNEHLTVMDAGVDSPVAAYLWAAATAAPIAYSADVDVARPFRSLELVGITGDTLSDKRNFNERNSILTSGVSTHTILDDGTVVIERMVTTYKTNNVGATDPSYRNLNTMTITSFCRQSTINMIQTTYPRHKLAQDGAPIPSGQFVVTPSVMRGSLLNLYQAWQDLFVAQDIDYFSSTLTVAIDGTDPSKLNIYMRPFYVGQFYISDVTLAFRLN